MDWLRYAACTREDPDLFFPVGTVGPAARQQEDAKKVCRRCPVRAQCLDYALRTGENSGVWGGTCEDERRRIRRRRPEYARPARRRKVPH
ncbi:WhiB family transcriptional regulator [Streptomyces sp. NPDC046261]|uniref:WhiB family transcriptional regulator n=1 Tax=Streptomyces sp. NPDC046261 TaxID=3157200 RepID=UPI0033C952C0